MAVNFGLNNDLIFKGGTLLAKSYADFYRMSEDLDFTLPMSENATRTERSQRIKPIKETLNNIEKMFISYIEDGMLFTVATPLTGSNQSRQYNMEIYYTSRLNNMKGRILIEIGLREQLIQKPVTVPIKTLLHDQFLGKHKVFSIELQALSLQEAYAEKIRAALTREKLAIRDFFDLDYAIEKNIIELNSKDFLPLVKRKIKDLSGIKLPLSDENLQGLKQKIQSELEPTLRTGDLQSFDLQRILEVLNKITKGLYEQ